jgi:hypothetical protein
VRIVEEERKQRVIDDTPIITIKRITNAPPIMQARNPTAKRQLKNTPRVHRRQTRNNTPGAVPLITRIEEHAINHTVYSHDASDPILAASMTRPPPAKFTCIARHNLISANAIKALTTREQCTPNAAFRHKGMNQNPNTIPINVNHYANPMVHPVTGAIVSSYKKAMHDKDIGTLWQTAFGKEFGGLAQGDIKTKTNGTNAIFVMTHSDIKKYKGKYTYARVCLDHRPQKDDPYRIRVTAGGNLIKYVGELSVRTADITTSKLLWNSVISTDDARYMCIDLKNFYLTANLDYYEYMKMPLNIFPQWIIDQYELHKHAVDGMVHIEMRKAVWGLPQAGILANNKLRKELAPHGYREHENTPGLWYHETRPITFTLVVDDFGVKYVGKEHADHLLSCLKKSKYKCSEDWKGSLYCGITLDWNYDAGYIDISMPGYIKKKLHEYEHICPKKKQTCPYSPEPKAYGVKAQAPLPPDETEKLDKKGILKVQKIVGSILYYARAVDNTVLIGLSSIAAQQTKATKKTLARCHQLLDYLASNPDAKIRFYKSGMILNIHSDASYLSELKARSRTCGYFFMGEMPIDGHPISLNGAFHVSTQIMKFVVASAAEAELGALFRNCQDGIMFRTTLHNLGHPQPRTPVHCDNMTAVGIGSNTVKRQRARAMEMRFMWVGDKIAQQMYEIIYQPGQESLADYQSKHHVGAHHVNVRPYYLHMENSPRFLARAERPSTLKGCVGTLKDGYIRRVPLPRVIPRRQSAPTTDL